MGHDFNKIYTEVFASRWAIFCNLFVAGLIFWGLVLDVNADPYFDEEEQQAGYEIVPNLYFESNKETMDIEAKMRLTENLILLGEIEMDGTATVQVRYILIN
tara:strand:- start:6059 stop:6364 length:306 start_codon:yes stop_codon:yes gene_type:complete